MYICLNLHIIYIYTRYILYIHYIQYIYTYIYIYLNIDDIRDTYTTRHVLHVTWRLQGAQGLPRCQEGGRAEGPVGGDEASWKAWKVTPKRCRTVKSY